MNQHILDLFILKIILLVHNFAIYFAIFFVQISSDQMKFFVRIRINIKFYSFGTYKLNSS